MKYVKRPVVIEAEQLTSTNASELAQWCGGVERDGQVTISTLEGAMLARPGDWIIRGIRGEYYPCQDGIFRECYVQAADTEADKKPSPGPRLIAGMQGLLAGNCTEGGTYTRGGDAILTEEPLPLAWKPEDIYALVGDTDARVVCGNWRWSSDRWELVTTAMGMPYSTHDAQAIVASLRFDRNFPPVPPSWRAAGAAV